MSSYLIKFISENTSALFALLGIVLGGLLSFFGSLILKKRDFKLKLWEKLNENRIKAHENVITLAVEMRVMIALGGVDSEHEVRRIPQILKSKDFFFEWFQRFTKLSQEGTTWLSIDTKRELNFVQDYLVTLSVHTNQIRSEYFPIIGEIIRQDFIDISESLEKIAFSFFKKGIFNNKIDDVYQWHKYDINTTERRIYKTVLLNKIEEIKLKYISNN